MARFAARMMNARSLAVGLGLAFLTTIMIVATVQAQSFQVIHSFTGQGDDATPGAGLTPDGAVFKLTPSNGSWIETDLHDFQSSDGSNPNGGLVFDSAGNLYGTTLQGGTITEICYIGCGTIWEITP